MAVQWEAAVDTAKTLTPSRHKAMAMGHSHTVGTHSNRSMDSLTIINSSLNTDMGNLRSKHTCTALLRLQPTEVCLPSKRMEDIPRPRLLRWVLVLGRAQLPLTAKSTITTKRLARRSGKSLRACPNLSQGEREASKKAVTFPGFEHV